MNALTLPKIAVYLLLSHTIVAAIAFGAGRYGAAAKATAKVVDKVNTATAAVKEKQEVVLAKADEKQIVVQEKIRTVYRDRNIYITKEIPREVIVKQDAQCVVPEFFVGLWNSSNRAVVPAAAGVVDESPSGVKLSDITAQHDIESEICHANTEQLKGLIAALRAQAAVTGGKVPMEVD